MHNRYSYRFPSASNPPSAGERRAEDEAGFLRMLGAIAPAAGGVVGGLAGIPGGPAGMAAGATAGMAVGGGVGSIATAAGESRLDPYRRKELRKQALLEAIMQARGLV